MTKKSVANNGKSYAVRSLLTNSQNENPAGDNVKLYASRELINTDLQITCVRFYAKEIRKENDEENNQGSLKKQTEIGSKPHRHCT